MGRPGDNAGDLRQAQNIIIRQTVRILRIGVVGFEVLTVVFIQSHSGTYPHEPSLVLNDAIDSGKRETILY